MKQIEKEEYIKKFQDGNLSFDKFCEKYQVKSDLFKNWIDKYFEEYLFLEFNDGINNSYVLYKVTKNESMEDIKTPIAKIIIQDLEMITSPLTIEDDFSVPNFNLISNNLLILKMKFINLDYYKISGDDIFKKIFVSNEKFKTYNNIRYSRLENTTYGKENGYFDPYTKSYLPKIIYNISLVFEIPKEYHEYVLTFKKICVEGIGIKKSNLKCKKEKIDLNVKCPNCESENIIKCGYKNEKQRYQCKDCKRKFAK